MNYTVQDIFDSAIRLIDEQNESTGSTETADTKPYRVKAVSLVRNLIPRVYPVSDTETLRRAGVIEQGEAGLEDLAVEYRRTAAQISIKIRECREAGIDTGHLGAMRRDLREAAAVLTRYYDYPRFGVGIWEPKHKRGKR